MIYKQSGIVLADVKKVLVEGRIRKRVKMHGLSSLGEYIDYLFSEKGLKEELIPLIDVVTTNKTDFFRENQHFEFLTGSVLPELFSLHRTANFWSAGCSTGEEPYTLAIVLNEFYGSNNSLRYQIYASDISTEVLQRAFNGVYENEKVEPVPAALKNKYFMRSKDPNKQIMRVVPELRSRVSFLRINLLEELNEIPGQMDVIFCRNVIIYFDKATQAKVLGNLIKKLVPGGYLFLGHSETIMGIELPVERAASTVYRRVR
jgi:chemotaxis protein methyltransferase CheR